MSLGIFGVALRSRVRVARGSELGGLCALGGGSPRHARKARVARDLGPPNRSGTPAFQWTVEICQHPGDRPSGRSTTDGQSITQVCGRLRGYLRGWKEYFRLADTPYILAKVDGWIRHRLRALHLKHWKRGPPIYRELRAWGLPEPAAAKVATNGRRWWKSSAMLISAAFPNRYFDQLGLPRLVA